MRTDLGAEGADLGFHQERAGGVELGQFHLRGHPVSHLPGGADQSRPGGRREGGHHTHHTRAGFDRGDHDGALHLRRQRHAADASGQELEFARRNDGEVAAVEHF
ncbi:hypothetical protein SRABI128_06179 [Microbacterium sp. Bi128]|nr:hypothetical protein SRABI128_06179 [Microbacterium sp. Bi128]